MLTLNLRKPRGCRPVVVTSRSRDPKVKGWREEPAQLMAHRSAIEASVKWAGVIQRAIASFCCGLKSV